MKSKVLFIILFSLIIIGVLYVTTIYAQELQTVGNKNANTYVKNIVPQDNSVIIPYSKFNGTFGPSQSFSFDYPSGWKSINVNEMTNSEIASFGLNNSSITVNVYLSCNNNTKIKGKNITMNGYQGIETITNKSIGLYGKNFNVVLNSSNSDRVQIFDHIVKSLNLYNKFSVSSCG